MWIILLKLIENKLPITVFPDYKKVKEKQVHKYNFDKLLNKIQKQNKKRGKREIVTLQYIRSPELAEFIKYKVHCECKFYRNPVPFTTNDKIPYLEWYHIIWLFKGDENSIKNTVVYALIATRKYILLIKKGIGILRKKKTIIGR